MIGYKRTSLAASEDGVGWQREDWMGGWEVALCNDYEHRMEVKVTWSWMLALSHDCVTSEEL